VPHYPNDALRAPFLAAGYFNGDIDQYQGTHGISIKRKVKIGKTASLYVPSVRYPAERAESGTPKVKKHWANGKWLCKKVVHYLSTDDARRLLTSTFLARSAFVGDENSTSIKEPNLLYKVIV
jgi:hypothetical protein